MPSLEELKGRVRVWERHFGQDAYALVGALVEKLEALEPEDIDATIRELREELAEAKAEATRWREESNLEMAARMMGKPLGPGLAAEFEKLKADAEIGRLVRGMQPNTSLRYARNEYHAARCIPGVGFRYIGDTDTAGPTEALRVIQKEVGDA